MNIKESFWILAFISAFLFTYGVLGIPTGLGAFLFFNLMFLFAWYVVRHSEHNKDLPKSNSSQVVMWIFTGFYILLTLPYLYRLDTEVTSSITLYHLTFLGLYFTLGVFPALMRIITPFSGLLYWVGFGVNWIISAFKAVFDLFKMGSSGIKFSLKAIVYIGASVIIFFLFAGLLSQADPNFKERIAQLLETIRFGELVIRTFIGIILLFGIAGLFKLLLESSILQIIGLKKESMDEKFEKLKTFFHTKDSDSFLPLLITVPIVGLFVLFVYLQFKYLFGVNVQEILSSLTFSQYAQRGFGELLTVVVLTYPVLAWVTNFSRSKSVLPRVLNFVVATLIVGCVYVMLYSAFVRMGIYTDVYGPSVKRNYVILGIAVLGIGMLGYELLALWKAIKPEKSLITSNFIGDFTIWSGILGSFLLCAVALYPWNNFTFGQIKEYYAKTGNLDVYQITDMNKEVAREVYMFSEELDAKNNPTLPGSKILKFSAIQKKFAYQEEVNHSIFSRIFGINLTGLSLEALNTPDLDKYGDQISSELSAEYGAVANKFVDAIENNDFETARKFYDPKMVPNDIVGLKKTVTVTIDSDSKLDIKSILDKYSRGPESEKIGYTGYISKYSTYYYKLYITRLDLPQAKPPKISQNADYIIVNESNPAKQFNYSSLRVNVGLRNGKAVIVDSNFVLSYLPDAVFTKESYSQSDDTISLLRSYGYQTYCEIPNAKVVSEDPPYIGSPGRSSCDKTKELSNIRLSDLVIKTQ